MDEGRFWETSGLNWGIERELVEMSEWEGIKGKV